MIEVRHVDPATHTEIVKRFAESLRIGRDPGVEGFIMAPLDLTVSSRALLLESVPSGIQLTNTSSFSECEIFLETGTRIVFPGESVVLRESCTVVVPGEVFSYRVELTLESKTVLDSGNETGTRRIVERIEIHPERWPVAVCICAHRFFPDRFGSVLPNANDISHLLAKVGIEVTPKAVNNKLQRLREDLSDRHGQFLESRHELVDFLVRQRIVSRADVISVLQLPT
jgi:hypothetical protein